ncbi:filamentous haemagglutinin family protein [Alcaligenes endophyticus]|uniref:Filamentous hemagglutinin family protein n=1 Tax=Alcaligenes endophyticus TaxID=1929088 RepID=A0ABT8EJI5_9BURK|nr:filamentous haemagglutinin family protein [Alcaligenes endophyticus]MCX5591774.1 filamentous hemagglutinin family protein [Alcaligenes endophyticus]MDN4121451.1 filamentous hemagglutinin family protein [Alcaligenes endophyticus]
MRSPTAPALLLPSSKLALKPLACAIALLGLSLSHPSHAQLRGAWFTQSNAAQQHQNANNNHAIRAAQQAANMQQQQAAARAQLSHSLDNLNRTASAIAAQQAAQNAARLAAQQQASNVAEGLAQGGLEVAVGDKAQWLGAEAPVHTQQNGQHHVGIKQTESKAILNWNRFDVGRNTTVEFQQKNTDAVLNRVVGDQVAPSQIQGRIKGDGTVMVVNQNGVVFSGTSQVNVRNLVAAAVPGDIELEQQFLSRGIYSDANSPVFKKATGKITIEAGARLQTHSPDSATRGGGYVLIVAKEVENAGLISSPKGQALLAAGDSFVIRRGQGTEGNQHSTTKGNEVISQGLGHVDQKGLILAPLGDISLSGQKIDQRGVLASSTSVDSRGTIHMQAKGPHANITLHENAVTSILPDEDKAKALDGQRDSLLEPILSASSAWQTADSYRRDLSLVHIDSEGTIDFRTQSLTLATGGQIAIRAQQRSLVREGARLDVSGAVGVAVAMEANNLQVNVQGNELRDAYVNRDQGGLKSNDVWLDIRELIYVPAGVGGADTDRWYTAGGLLEVGGYLGTRALPVSHWLAQGGTVTFTGNELISEAGSLINLSGGTLDVQSGYLRQSWLLSQNGRIYNANRAPNDLFYSGIFKGYEVASKRWGHTRTFTSPLMAPAVRHESGYVLGRDAGTLVVSTRSAVLEGEVVGHTYEGLLQTLAPLHGRDGYQQSHRAQARGAALVVGSYSAYFSHATKTLKNVLGSNEQTAAQVVIQSSVETIASQLGLDAPLDPERLGTVWLDAEQLNSFDLGAFRIAARDSVRVESALSTRAGGEIHIFSPQTHVLADLRSAGGRIQLGNVQNQPNNGRSEEVALAPRSGKTAEIFVGANVSLDTRGTWTNLSLHQAWQSQLAYKHGGDIILASTGNVTLATGSTIDVSAGAVLTKEGALVGGKAGNVSVAADAENVSLPAQQGLLHWGAQVRAYGVTESGTLSLNHGGIINIGEGCTGNVLCLEPSLLQSGFSHYQLNGHAGLRIHENVDVDVLVPVLQLRSGVLEQTPSSTGLDTLLEVWTPPLYQGNAITSTVQQRRGASVSLLSDRNSVGGEIYLAPSSRLRVDPGQAIQVRGGGQVTLMGHIAAPGGRISIGDTRGAKGYTGVYNPQANALSVWIGEHAVLSVAGESYTAINRHGQRYGVIRAGGEIEIGGQFNWERGEYLELHERYMDRHLIIRPGALLDASGTQTTWDLPSGGATQVDSHGGTLVLASANSLYLDGRLQAMAGGHRAEGGTLAIALNGAYYYKHAASEAVVTTRVLNVMQEQAASPLADSLLAGQEHTSLQYGRAYLGVDRIQAGGFGSLSVFAQTQMADDVSLRLPFSLRLSSIPVLGEAVTAGKALHLEAPYIYLHNSRFRPLDGGDSFVLPFTQIAGVSQQWQAKDHHLSLNADLLDAQGIVDFRYFDRTVLDVKGDFRLLPNIDSSFGGTQVLAPHYFDIRAAQVYSVTGAQGAIIAGDYHAQFGGLRNPDAKLILRRATADLPSVPLAAFSNLSLSAPFIEQGGIVRAPLGVLSIRTSDFGPQVLRLLPDSISSVSADSVVLPYGGTADGIHYLYQGKPITPTPIGGAGGLPLYDRRLTLSAVEVDIQAGAVLDLRGGGEIFGAGFVSGRGGSIDVLLHPLADSNPRTGFSRSGNNVYAVVPGVQAPYSPIAGLGQSGIATVGQQLNIRHSLPGLEAGTYTLLPASFALLPGAFRVEIEAGPQRAVSSPVQTRTGSWVSAGHLSSIHTGRVEVLPHRVLITPANVVRKHSQYNEQSYADFLLADAARRGIARAMLPQDASMLDIRLGAGAGHNGRVGLSIKGDAMFEAAVGSTGFGGVLAISGAPEGLEVLTREQRPVLTAKSAAIYDSELRGLRPGRLVLGGLISGSYGEGYQQTSASSEHLLIRSGVTIAAPDILLLGSGSGAITVEQGATLSTLGQGAALQDIHQGFYISPFSTGLLAVTNGEVRVQAPEYANATKITLGACLSLCTGMTRVVSEGTIAVATNGALEIGDAVEYGTRHLSLSVATINLGTQEALQAAQKKDFLPPGMVLNQHVLGQLLRGNTALGTPALESLILTAGEAVNVFGSVLIDTRFRQDQAALQRLVLGAPAIYGYGASDDVATIMANEFIWAGSTAADPTTKVPGYAQFAPPGGAMTPHLGDGQFNVHASKIRFEPLPYSTGSLLVPAQRLMLGFSQFNLLADEFISATAKGSLHVYHHVGQYQTNKGWDYQGGHVMIQTPVVVGEGGAVFELRAGGTLKLLSNGQGHGQSQNLGASWSIEADTIELNTAFSLPSGYLSLKAEGDIRLGAQAQLDLAGRALSLLDVTRYSWGGDLELLSRNGNIEQMAGSLFNVSAQNHRAGTLSFIADSSHAGQVHLAGEFLAAATGFYDAGGTYVPYEAGAITIRAQRIENFQSLNQGLNRASLTGARRFQILSGDVHVGEELQARHIELVVDGGSLWVNGVLDASGVQVGSIHLAAQQDLHINALLDAHSSHWRRDSYGKIIDSPNRAVIELTSRQGEVFLHEHASFDLRAGTLAPHFNDGLARGTLTINVRRTGGGSERGALLGSGDGAHDVALQVQSTPIIRGAKTVNITAFRRYTDAPFAQIEDVNGNLPQVLSQSYFEGNNGLHADNQAFMQAVLSNSTLATRLKGLGTYQIRPGVEVSTATPNGDLLLQGDIDLSGYRYGPEANPARRGYGIPGVIWLRAGGNLSIYGSINDGFAPPPDSPDDNGWLLREGLYSKGVGQTAFGQDLLVPIEQLTLDAGTRFPEASVLNYDVPIQAVTLPAGVETPVAVTLSAPLTLPQGLVLTADIQLADGGQYVAGTVLTSEVILPVGTRLAAGFRLRTPTAVQSMIWPKGVPLAAEFITSVPLVLARGSLIPSNTLVRLPDRQAVSLRPVGQDGKQGKNWALAPMLGEKASSWDLALTAGSQLESSHIRSTNSARVGDLLLADAHQGLVAKASHRIEREGGGDLVLSEAGALDIIGDPAVAGMTQAEISDWLLANWGMDWEGVYGHLTLQETCSWSSTYCVNKPGEPRLTEDGALGLFDDLAVVGMTQTEIDQWMLNVWGLGWEGVFGNSTLEQVCSWSSNYCLVESAIEVDVFEHEYVYGTPLFSVLRTGTGDLSLSAARDVGMSSVYGVYTAGAQTSLGQADTLFNRPRALLNEFGELGLAGRDGGYDAALHAYQAWYPDQGGNVWVQAGRDIYGDNWGHGAQNGGEDPNVTAEKSGFSSASVGNWLWRQGIVDSAQVQDIVPSWWINFGTYANSKEGASGSGMTVDSGMTRLYGFSGFGTLGGGNLSLQAGRHMGVIRARGDALANRNETSGRSQGVVAVVASTGRVLGGELLFTGGGDLTLRMAGGFNPNVRATQQGDGLYGNSGRHYSYGGSLDNLDLNGVLVNLRGAVNVQAAHMGAISVAYGDGGGIRARNPFAIEGGLSMGGPRLVLGDATAWLETRGDLVLGNVNDPTRVSLPITHRYELIEDGQTQVKGGDSWFSLWSSATAVNLTSAGGNLTPLTANNSFYMGSDTIQELTHPSGSPNTSTLFVYPSVLKALAPKGNIMLASSVDTYIQRNDSLMLAPSSGSELELIAGQSILAAPNSHRISVSGADVQLPSPWMPAFTGSTQAGLFPVGNISPEGILSAKGGHSLFAFGPNIPLERSLKDQASAARFYAVGGDIVGLKTGGIVNMTDSEYNKRQRQLDSWVEAAMPVRLWAAQDILGPSAVLVHNTDNDISLLRSGRDMIYSQVQIYGPGSLILEAGRHFRQDDKASIHSLGGLVRGDTRPGADIALIAGAAHIDYQNLLKIYLDPKRQLSSGQGLDTQLDKVVQAYSGQLTLADWLAQEFSYTGSEEDAPLALQQAYLRSRSEAPQRDLAQDYRHESDLYLVNWLQRHHAYDGPTELATATFLALSPEQQGIYARQLFFAELKKSGREYNDMNGPRYGSYLRGRRAIAALTPQSYVHESGTNVTGEVILYGGAGLRTHFGGDIQILTPFGQQVLGIEGEAPPASAGIVTQGKGQIQLYSSGSILLGQSRIMSTFGGHIMAWSAQGDINAGRGTKTTIVYTPPRRVYDSVGNVSLAPTVPSTGAGIATLAPIAEVPAGDVDLIAPLGTIDAGEAGIRVSGNVNLAALHVVNADNIQVQGESKGMPIAVSVNVGALTSASSAASSAATAAQETLSRARDAARSNQPSQIQVQVLGFGAGPVSQGPEGQGRQQVARPVSQAVSLVGRGPLNPTQASMLTQDERRQLGL